MSFKKTHLICCVFTVFIFTAYSDNVAPSSNPPGGLSPKNVPQFVNIGFDDNACDDGIQWVIDLFKNKKNPIGQNGSNPLTYDGTPCRVVFYLTSNYGKWMKSYWQTAKSDGHEIGNHSVNHDCTNTWTLNQWKTEIDSCNKWLTSNLSMNTTNLWGFRTPMLACNTNTFAAIKQSGLIYDCTLSGGSSGGDGSQFNWPYTMDNGSPGDNIGTHPGLWEVPTHNVVRTTGIKITGLDYNMWVNSTLGGASMDKETFIATLKNTFDRRYDGNRAPFTFGAHSDYYSPTNKTANDASPNATCQQRREALQAFVEYVLTKPDVRIVTSIDIIKWMRNPVGLNSTDINLAGKHNTNNSLSLQISNPGTLSISVPQAGFYSCILYSISGKRIRTLISGNFAQGAYTLDWDQNSLPKGIYLITLHGSHEQSIARVTVL